VKSFSKFLSQVHNRNTASSTILFALLFMHQAQEVLGVKGGVGKNPSPTSAKNKVKLKYISEGQPSSLELAFGVELGLNSHS